MKIKKISHRIRGVKQVQQHINMEWRLNIQAKKESH